MKKKFKKIFTFTTSKKLLWIITSVWFISTVANYVFGFNTIDTISIQNTYENICDLFKWELIIYSGKATIEKTNLITSKITETINNLSNKDGEV